MARSTPIGDREVMRLVAELYYERDLGQPEVAAMTGFSVSKVSRLLSAAREQGVVRIVVEPAPDEHPAIATELGERFGIEVVITPGNERDPAAAARLCGLASADALVRWLPASGVVGIAAGFTVGALVSALPRLNRPGLTIVPLVGGWDSDHPFLDGNEQARRMAERLGGQSRTLHAPAFLDTAAIREALLRDSTIAPTASLWPRLDVAVLGIGGSPEAHPGYRTAIDRLGEGTRAELRAIGAVGDLAGHFFRSDGTFEASWSERMLAIPIEDLRRARWVVAIAAGSSKVAAIVGALRTGLLSALMTDRATAEAVLRRSGPPR